MSKSVKDQLAGKTSKLARRKAKDTDHPAKLHNYKDGDYYRVPINLIQPNPDQPRKYFNPDSLAELGQSIKEKGVLQPVIVRTDKDNTVYLIAGERRLRAAKIAGLKEVPVIYSTGNPAEIALIENLQRENLNPIEEAEALNRMIKEYKYTQEQLASVVGKDRTTITVTLSLNKLPEEIKKECERVHIYPKRLLIEVAKQKTPKKMVSLFNQIKKDNLKSDQVKDITINQKERVLHTPASIVLNKVLGLNKNISKLDLTSIEEEEKNQLLTELENLKNNIEKLLV